MADTVTSQIIANGPRYHTVHLTGISDGTGNPGAQGSAGELQPG